MAKSFVRISKKAKTAASPLYAKAVREFVKKMGGPWAVISAITEEIRKDQTLLDNTPVRMPEPVIEEECDTILAGGNVDEEDELFGRLM